MSCLYATCAAAARSAAPIKSIHVMMLRNIHCHSAARYIPATARRDKYLRSAGYICWRANKKKTRTRTVHVNHELNIVRYRKLHNWTPLLRNSWHKSRMGMTPDPSSSREGAGPPD